MATVAPSEEVALRLAVIQGRIGDAARDAGRNPAEVTLVAVTKSFPPDLLRPAVEAGVRDLGENRVQEAEGKVGALTSDVRWHLIGHLQRNKVNKALAIFSLIHSVDTAELVRAIGARAQRQGQPAVVLLQVNVADKETQTGFPEADVASTARQLARTPGLVLDGLMCIAPEVDDAALARPYFRRLAALHRQLAGELRDAGHPWRHLSMGMSNDFPVAVQEGATLVRVGRAIFGERR